LTATGVVAKTPTLVASMDPGSAIERKGVGKADEAYGRARWSQ
jgi:hypothetical protein